MKRTLPLLIRIALAWSLCLPFVACDRAPNPNALETTFTGNDLLWLEGELNRNIAAGSLATFTNGDNPYELRLTGAAPLVWTLNIKPQTVGIPFGFAVVQLGKLRIRNAQCRWNASERALHVTFRLEDNPAGILADVTILNQKTKREFTVESGKVQCYLEPKIAADGSLDFAPVRVLMTTNTDDVAPELREIVRAQLVVFGNRVASELQTLLNLRKAELVGWFSKQRMPGTVLTAMEITNEQARFAASVPLPEDLTGDRVVDIADLIHVARDFGREGVPRFVPADLNGDGTVDIADIALVARKFGTRI